MNTGKIRQGFGYWDCTSYPIGGRFRRAGAGGLQVTAIERLSSRVHGSNARGKAIDEQGREMSIAFTTDALEPDDQLAIAN